MWVEVVIGECGDDDGGVNEGGDVYIGMGSNSPLEGLRLVTGQKSSMGWSREKSVGRPS